MDIVKEAQKKRLLKIKEKKALHGWFSDDFCGINKYYSQFNSDEYVIVSFTTERRMSNYPDNIIYLGTINECKGNVKNTNLPEPFSTIYNINNTYIY
jgi:hypothetical protein